MARIRKARGGLYGGIRKRRPNIKGPHPENGPDPFNPFNNWDGEMNDTWEPDQGNTCQATCGEYYSTGECGGSPTWPCHNWPNGDCSCNWNNMLYVRDCTNQAADCVYGGPNGSSGYNSNCPCSYTLCSANPNCTEPPPPPPPPGTGGGRTGGRVRRIKRKMRRGGPMGNGPINKRR